MKIHPDEYCVVAAVAADTLDPCEGGRRADQMTVLDHWIVAIMFNERFLYMGSERNRTAARNYRANLNT